MLGSVAMSTTITSAQDLQRFLDLCAAHPNEWQVLSPHASMNAAKIKVHKIRRGEMSNTLKRALDRGEVEIRAYQDEITGPVVKVKWVESVEVAGAFLGGS